MQGQGYWWEAASIYKKIKNKNASCGENHPQNLSSNAREI
jgi:hypothetical protein